MRCEECRPLVEDYFDGELDEQTVLLVAQHLSACVACASLYEKLQGEQELYLNYECDAQPAPDFWDNVMARAAQENAARSSRPLPSLRLWLVNAVGNFNAPRLSPSLTAIIVLAAIGITIAVMRYSNVREVTTAPVSVAQNEGLPGTIPSPLPDEVFKQTNPKGGNEAVKQEAVENGAGGKGSQKDEDEQSQLVKNESGRKGSTALAAGKASAGQINLRPSASGRKPTSDELVREAEQKYVEAIAMLSRDVNRRRSRLDPETATQFERTLAAVDRTIADTRRAARRHPGDPVAAQYMLTAYARKVDVLREMVSY